MAEGFGLVAVRMGAVRRSMSGDTLRACSEAAAFTVKRTALRRVVLTIGGDRRMSRFGSRRSRGRVRAGIGYDHAGGGTTIVKYRPAGMWQLLEYGAKAHQVPRKVGRRRPILVVNGRPVTGPVQHPGTRPKGVLTRAARDADPLIPVAVEEALAARLEELLDA